MVHPPVERDSTQSVAPCIRILEILGTELGQQFLTHFAGRILYVPQRVILDHPIVEILGLEAAKIFQAEFGGQQLNFSRQASLKRAERNSHIWKKRQEGKSIQSLSQ